MTFCLPSVEYLLDKAIEDFEYMRDELGFKCMPLYPQDPNDPDNKEFKSNMIIEKTYAFPRKWQKDETHNKETFKRWNNKIVKTIEKEQAVLYAVLTGKVNGITVIDLDIAKAKNRNQEFENLVQSAETFKVSTPKGEHHYFDYFPYIKTSSNFLGYIDFRNDGGCAIGAGVLRDDGFYSLLEKNDSINEISVFQKIPKKLFDKIDDKYKIMVDSQPSKCLSSENQIMTMDQMEQYIKDRKENTYTTVSLKDFEYLCEHLLPDKFDNYHDWSRIAWAMHNVAEYNTYKDKGFEIFDKLSQQSNKYNHDHCHKIYYGARADGARLGWTFLKSCVDDKYDDLQFLVDNPKPSDGQGDILSEIDKLKITRPNKGDLSDMVTSYFIKIKNKNIAYDPLLKRWYVCDKFNIWNEDPVYQYIIDTIKKDIAPLFKKIAMSYYEKSLELLKKPNASDSDQNLAASYGKFANNLSQYESYCKSIPAIQDVAKFMRGDFGIKKFYDKYLDKNINLFSFSDKVLDLNKALSLAGCETPPDLKDCIRDIKTDDYIYTNTEYPFPHEYDQNIYEEVENVLRLMFSSDEEYQYVLSLKAKQLYGSNKQELFIVETGSGSNGKSLFSNLHAEAFGEYYMQIAPEVFTKGKQSANETSDLVNTKGKRSVCASEPPNNKNNKMQSSVVKSTTGGDKIRQRGLFKECVEFKPQFNITLLCNNIPQMDDVDGGIIRRLSIINYAIKFIDDDKLIKENPNKFKKIDLDLREKFRDDARYRDAYIWLLMKTFIKYKGEVLPPPQSVVDITTEYFRESNDVLMFMLENTKTAADEKAKVKTSTVLKLFKKDYPYSEIASTAVFSKKLIKEGYICKPYGNNKLSHIFDIEIIDRDDDDDKKKNNSNASASKDADLQFKDEPLPPDGDQRQLCEPSNDGKSNDEPSFDDDEPPPPPPPRKKK